MPRLAFRVDQIALLREASALGGEPDPVAAALAAEAGGAGAIVASLRNDRRHIQERDVRMLREICRSMFRLEIAPAEESVAVSMAVRPAQVLVAEDLGEQSPVLSPIDLMSKSDLVRPVVDAFREAEIAVGVRIEPSTQQIKLAEQIGFQFAEVSVARFAFTWGSPEGEKELERISDAASLAKRAGFYLCAGQGVDYRNVQTLFARAPFREYTIGQAIVSRGLLVGITDAVRQMGAVLRGM